MTKDEALKLALEALENIYDGFKTSPRAQYTAITAIKEALAQPSDSVEEPIDFALAYGGIYKAQREALAEALAQPEQIKYRRGDWLRCLETDDVCVVHMSGSANQWVKFPDGDVLSFTNEQVAELFDKIPKERDWEGIAADQAMTIALLKSEQEPVAKVVSSGEYDFPTLQWLSANQSLDTAVGSLLYPSPPKREWAGLTEKDAELVYEDVAGQSLRPQDYRPVLQFAKAIEAKLKELNS